MARKTQRNRDITNDDKVQKKDASSVFSVWLALGIIFFLSLAAYWTSFHNEFVFDDRATIIDESSIRNLNDLAPIVGTAYRPLVRLVNAINYSLGGINPFGYHLVNFAAHVGVAFLLFLIFGFMLNRYFQEKIESRPVLKPILNWLPLIGALIFALHPVNTESVSYISSRSSLFCAFFFLLAFYLYITGRNYWLVLGAFLLSLTAKEISAVLPLILVLYDITLGQKTFKEGLKNNAWLFGLLGVLLIYKLNFGGVASLYTDGALKQRTLPQHIFTELSVIATYFRLMFCPVNLTLDYDYHASSFNSSLGLFLAAFMIFGTFYWRKTFSLFSFCLGYIFLNLLTVTGPILFDYLFEHHLYLILPGVILGVLTLLFTGLIHLSEEQAVWSRNVLTVLVVVILGLMIYGTAQRNTCWKDELILWRDCVSKAPNKARPHANFGNALKERGQLELAEQEYLKALSINPDYVDVMISLGAVYLDKGQFVPSENLLKKALGLRADGLALYNLALLYGRQGNDNLAEYYYIETLKKNPHYAMALNNLGNVYGRRGDNAKAEQYYLKAIQERYYMGEAHNNLGAVYANRGEYDKAAQEFQIALRCIPPYYQSYCNLGDVYELTGHKPEAIQCYQLFLQYFPNHPAAGQIKAKLNQLMR